MGIHLQRWGGQGAEVVLVHGSVMNGEMSWAGQRPLADRWRLVVVDRRGYFPNPPADHEDFEEDVPTSSISSATALLQNARLLMVERDPTEAVIPLARLQEAPFPKLVVSGAHSAVFDAVCDVLEKELGAERAVIPGAGHSVPRTGAPFNERLEALLNAAEAKRPAA